MGGRGGSAFTILKPWVNKLNNRKEQHKLRLARRRLDAFLRGRGISTTHPDGSRIKGCSYAALLEKETLILRGNIKVSKYIKAVAKRVTLEGRDLKRHTPCWANKQRIKKIYRNNGRRNRTANRVG